MGSNQSSPNEPESFSIDPSGNISHNKHSSAEKSSKQQQQSNNAQPDPDPQQIFTTQQAPASAPVMSNERVSSTRQQDDGLSLKDADEIVTRMKTKYKPAFEEMAGKQKSVFEEHERKVAHCYATNKNQPLNCSQVTEEYKSFVRQQRSQLLKNSVNVPLVTTALAIIACLLLHITTVQCYGAMSIDLGSEWMKVGLVAPSVQMDIVLNAQSQRKTPMAIAFSNGERFIGDPALDIASKYPEKTFTHFLDLAGKTIDDESVKHYKQRFPYADIASHEPNSTSIILKHPEGFSFTPLELLAMMIEHAHDQVATRLNNNEPSTDVVITVPPFFNSIERRVVIDAARLVGLSVLRLTNVNSAFALSYGIFRHKDYEPESSPNKTTILFFDQGASHTSVTLADYHLVEQIDDVTKMSKNESLPTVTIRAQTYDRHLGGFDMQLKLRDHLVDVFAKKNNIDKTRIYKRGRSAAKVLKESGRVKKVLSANMDHLVRIENVIDDKDLRHPISRKEFEDLNQEYLGSRVTKLLDRLFEMPEVERYEPVESIIIVGGNTRTPKLQQVLLEYFKLETLGKSINADEGAALAALYQAASLGRGFRVKKFNLEEFGEIRKRFDPAKVVTSTTTTTTVAPEQAPTDVSTTEQVVTKDPDAIYSDAELDRIHKKLADLKEQDYLRLQRLSLMNSLESLLSEGRDKLSEDDEKLKERRDEIQKLIKETYSWLEDGPQHEKDNLTLLADKYTDIHDLIHPRPPPTQAPPTTLPPIDPMNFDPSKFNLSDVLGNKTMSILDALSNLTNPFGGDEESMTTTATTTTDQPAVDQSPDSTTSETPEPSKVETDTPRSEL